jgi:hypothetical protein
MNRVTRHTTMKGTKVSNPCYALRSLLHPRGVAGPARLRACLGSGAPSPRTLALTALVSLCALAFTAAPALAREVHIYNHSFGEPGTEAGQFENPSDIAVNDATGDVYVVDRGNNRIDEFEANGTFIQAWGYGVAEGVAPKDELQTCSLACYKGIAGTGQGQLDEPQEIAVDNSGKPPAEDPSVGDVYVTNTATGDSTIEKFGPAGEYLGEITTGAGGIAFSPLDGVAVDPRGLVWVDQSEQQVDTYSDAAANVLLSSSEAPEYRNLPQPGLPGGRIPGFAVDSRDDLYVAYGGDIRSEFLVARLNSVQEIVPGSAEQRPQSIDLGELTGLEVGAPQPQDAGPTGGGNGAKTGIAVDPANDDVYLDMNGNELDSSEKKGDPFWDVEELAADGATIEDFGSAQLADHGGSGLAVDSSTGAVYVADDVAGAVFLYTTVPTPTVHTGAASDLDREGSATLNGTVDPEEIALEECKFEYVSDVAFKEPYANEVQSVVTRSEFILAFAGDETVALAEHALPATVQEALEALPAIGSGNVVVHGVGLENFPYKIEFTGALAHTKVPELTAKTGEITVAVTTVSGDGGWHSAASAACEPEVNKITGSGDVPVTASVLGLTPDSVYRYRLDARNVNGDAEGEEQELVAPARPAIEGVSLTDVLSSAATLSAEIDPGGAPTGYRVEYGTSEAYGSSTPEASVGAGLTSTPVQVSLSGLLPGTVYYARIVAGNEVAVAQGAALTFTTPGAAPVSASVLPDGRAFELVSNFPPGQDEETYVPASGNAAFGIYQHGITSSPHPFQVAADGEAVVYAGDPPPTAGSSSQGESNGNEYLARRTPGGVWAQVDLQPPKLNPAFLAFSSDLSIEILAGSGEELGGVPGGYVDLYAHATAGGAGGAYEPLYAGTPPNRSSSQFANVQFHGSPETGLHYDGANAGTSAVPAAGVLLFDVDDALLAGSDPLEQELDADVAQEVTKQEEGNYLYASSAGRLSLVDVLPDGKVQPNASFGSFPVTGGNRAGIPAGVSNAISADGSRIFWTALSSSDQPQALYVRENDTSPAASTVQVDASQGGLESGGGMFRAASGDGSKVLFTDCRRLTADSTAVSGGGCSHLTTQDYEGQTAFTGNDLYEYEVNPETGQPGVLRDLTVDHNGDPLGADVQGVLGSSEDGEYVYFAAQGRLAGNENANGETAKTGEDNLYLSHDGSTTFIATLSPQDGSEVQPLAACGQAAGCRGDWQTAPSYRTAEVTPDGHSLVFMSNRSLTGYDNDEGGKGLFEVFLYETQSGSGSLSCVSCNPSGEPPVVTEFNTDKADLQGIGAIGAFIPTGEGIKEPPRVVSADGSRVFFDSAEPLLPADTNGWLDVYEWERGGAGSCTDSRGCVYLLSGGTDPEDSYLIGADESGDNVFFVSRAELVPADRGGDDDEVYDARVDGSQPPAGAACEGTGCQGVPPTPPIFATPSSATITGIDDYPPPSSSPPPKKTTKKTVKCKKPKKLTHGKCVKPNKIKHAKKAEKSAHTDRRPRR